MTLPKASEEEDAIAAEELVRVFVPYAEPYAQVARMRSTIGRVAFRGASRLLAPANSRAALATCYPITSRKHCSTSTASTDGIKKAEETDITAAAKASALGVVEQHDTAEVSIIADDTTIPAPQTVASEGVIAGSIEESNNTNAESGDGNTESLTARMKRDPDALKNILSEALQKRAVRSALWYYTNAMKVQDQPGIDDNVMKTILPLLGRYGWAPSSMDTLKLAVDRGYNLGVGYYNCGLHAISRSGDTTGITELLEGMWQLPRESHPNAASYTYLIGAHVYRGGIDDAFEVLKDMKKHLIYPTFATYHALITGCLRRRDSQRAYSTLIAVEKQRFDISAMTVSQVLVSSAQNDDCEHVLNLIAKLEESLPRYTTEMHRIAESRATYRMTTEERTTKAERAELRGGPKPEIGAISEVLHCAFRTGRVDVAVAGWSMLRRHYPDLKVPASLWYCMIGALAGAGDFSRAFDVLGAMREAGYSPNLKDLEVALVRPLSGDVAKIDEQFFRLADKVERRESGDDNDNTEEATVTFIEAEAKSDFSVSGEEPKSESSDVDALSPENVSESETDLGSDSPSVLDDASEKESLAEILSKPDRMDANILENEFAPKTVGIDELNCVIASCSFAGDLDRAFQTYDEVESRFHLERNTDTYNALLEGCVQVRHVRGGLRILKEMESVGIKVSGSTVHLAIRLLLRGGRLEEAVDMVRTVQSKGGATPIQTYQMLVRNCVRGGSVDHAATVVEIAGNDGIEGRVLTGRLNFDAVKMLQNVANIQSGDGNYKRNQTRSSQIAGEVDTSEPFDLISDEEVEVDTEGPPDELTDVTDSKTLTETSKQ